MTYPLSERHATMLAAARDHLDQSALDALMRLDEPRHDELTLAAENITAELHATGHHALADGSTPDEHTTLIAWARPPRIPVSAHPPYTDGDDTEAPLWGPR